MLLSKMKQKRIERITQKKERKKIIRKLMFAARLEHFKKEFLFNNPEKSLKDYYKFLGTTETSYRRMVNDLKISETAIIEICQLLGVNAKEWTDTGIRGYIWMIKQRISEGYIGRLLIFCALIYFWLYMCCADAVHNYEAVGKVFIGLIILLFLLVLTTRENLWGRKVYTNVFSTNERRRMWGITIVLIGIYVVIDLLELFR